MKTLSIYSPNAIAEATKLLDLGHIVVYPTDTLYGLGADALNSRAVEKISKIKGRLGPWSIAVSNFEMLKKYCRIPKNHAEFVQDKLPGPITLIFPEGSKKLAPELLGLNQSIGVRIPNNSITQQLITALGKPITSTSVNRTGESPLNDPNLIRKNFSNEIDLILDAGTLLPSSGSTIYDLSTDIIKNVR